MIALVGQNARDVILYPDGTTEVRLGGAPLYGARALVATGCRPAIAARGADELAGPLRPLADPFVFQPGCDTFTSELDLRSDGGRIHRLASLGTPFTRADIETWVAPALADARVVVVGAQWRGDFETGALDALADGSRRLLLDAQGLARPSRLGLVEPEGPLDTRAIASVALLKASVEEAEALIGPPSTWCSCPVPLVVTFGQDGAVLHLAGRRYQVRPRPVLQLADAVGAGDAFLALCGKALAEGAALPEAVQAAGDATSDLLAGRQLASS